jgi:asparagine synthase (glutamine-hydrolysing)
VNEHQPKQKNKKSKKIKNQLKPFLPKFIKEKKLAEKDWNNYQVITNEMLTYLAKQDVNVQRKYENYNEIITQWFLYFSKTDVK